MPQHLGSTRGHQIGSKNSSPVARHDNNDRYERFFEVIARVVHLLASKAELEETLTAILEELYFKLGLARGTAMLFTPNRVELFVQTPSASLSPWHRNLRYRPSEGVVGAAVQARQPVITPRTSDHLRQSIGAKQSEENCSDTIEFICVPILMGNEVVGAISADLPKSEEGAIDDLLRLLKVVANLIATDIRVRRFIAVPENLADKEDCRGYDIAPEDVRAVPFVDESAVLLELQDRMRSVEECIELAVQFPDGDDHDNDRRHPLRFSDLFETAQIGPLKTSVQIMERLMIRWALRNMKGSITKAAAQLGISSRMLRYKMKTLGINSAPPEER
jgi:transcriptional regulator with GAF, ATPase, and Fis domain